MTKAKKGQKMLHELPPEILGIILSRLQPRTIFAMKSVSKRLKEVIEGLGVVGRPAHTQRTFQIAAVDSVHIDKVSHLSGNKWLIISKRNLLVYDLLHDPAPKFSFSFLVKGRGTYHLN